MKSLILFLLSAVTAFAQGVDVPADRTSAKPPAGFLRLVNKDGVLWTRDPNGVEALASGGGETTASSLITAAQSMTDSQKEDMRAAESSAEAQEMHSRLWTWRKFLQTNKTGDVGVFGDSMVAAPETVAEMEPAFTKAFGSAGYCFLEPYDSGGATKYSGASGIFTHWFNGTIVRLSGSGHTATVNIGSTSPVEADTIKLFYVKKTGGGVFKVQTRMNSGTWTDEASYLTVDTNASTDGGVITIAKTNLCAKWDVRAVYVSGGQVDIIGGALYDTRLRGIRYGLFGVGSTEMSQSITASSTVTGTIMASVGVDLALLSHLDGAADVPTHQVTFQDMINTASGTAPNWVIIGPPVGQTDVEDALRKAQALAMKNLANSRRDPFWDNRRWAGTPTQAVAAGLHSGTVDPHYENVAAANWIPAMIHELGLAETRTTTAGAVGDLRLLDAPIIRRDEIANTNDGYLRILGDFAVGPVPGLSPANVGQIRLYDTAGPSSGNDWGGFAYTSDALILKNGAAEKWRIDDTGGQSRFYNTASNTTTPNGLIGNASNPVKEVHIGKTVVGATFTTPQTINKAAGRINFAAADASKVVTSSVCNSSSIIIATVATNDSTMKSVQAVAGSGSFTLHANAAPTAETAVNWWLIPTIFARFPAFLLN
jgi:hypothetical protein